MHDRHTFAGDSPSGKRGSRTSSCSSVEHVQVLFVSDVLLDVRFRYTAGFRESLPTAERVANAYIFERSPQNSVGGTSTVSHLNLPSVRSSPRNQRMILLKVRSVQPV